MISEGSQAPLAKIRLVATLPPKSFFGGNNLMRALDQIAALRRLGATVYEFDTTAVYTRNLNEISRQQAEITAFRPHAIISTPNAGYVVQGGMITDNSGQNCRNVFLDDLELPAVLFWDHALTQPARYLLNWPANPSQSSKGALGILKSLFHHPRVVHYLPDSGHAAALEALGIASFGKDTWYVQEVGLPFLSKGSNHAESDRYDDDVAFFGNLYLATSRAIPYSNDQRLAEMRRRAQAACAADWQLPAFKAYTDAIASFDSSVISSRKLNPDQSFYWRFLFDELSRVMNAEPRLRILESCKRPVACYGNFNDPASNEFISGNCIARAALPYNDKLANAFRRTRIVVDIANAVFINGFSVKPIVCFAAGGFVLTTRKADFVRALGPIANEVIYDNENELVTKIDYFLSNVRERLELAAEIGSYVRREYTAQALYTKTLPAALARLGTGDRR